MFVFIQDLTLVASMMQSNSVHAQGEHGANGGE